MVTEWVLTRAPPLLLFLKGCPVTVKVTLMVDPTPGAGVTVKVKMPPDSVMVTTAVSLSATVGGNRGDADRSVVGIA